MPDYDKLDLIDAAWATRRKLEAFSEEAARFLDSDTVSNYEEEYVTKIQRLADLCSETLDLLEEVEEGR